MKGSEEVVLVDDLNNPLGTMPKETVHSANTPLHRGFSVFLFDGQGKVLLQQRSREKKTWPLVWSGSCCGHPGPDESVEAAIRRRALWELGISEIKDLTEILPDFRYQCLRDGIMENEICPVWVGEVEEEISPNPHEVEAYKWKDWKDLYQEIAGHPGTYSEWCELEINKLDSSKLFLEYLKNR